MVVKVIAIDGIVEKILKIWENVFGKVEVVDVVSELLKKDLKRF